MSDIKIEKQIPIPFGAGNKNRTLFPWEKMEIGDSIFIEGRTTRSLSSAHKWGKKDNRRFCLRTVEGGIRIWRIA